MVIFLFPLEEIFSKQSRTKGLDGLLQLSYSPTYELEMFIRYRYKKKEKDFTAADKTKQTIPSIQQKCRYQLNYSVKDKLTLKP